MTVLYVNQERIDPGLIEAEFQAIKAHFEGMGKVSCCERDPEFRDMARDNLVARALLNQESHRLALEVPETEIEETLSKLELEAGGRDAFLQNLGLHPCQIDEVRGDIRNGLRVEKTLRASIGEPPEPTEAELHDFHQKHISDYLTEEEMEATHLFKKVEKVEERQEIYDLLRDLRRQAKAGADFTALATEHTDKEDKLVDLGWFKQGDFMDEFGVIIFSMEVGEMSPVFASYFGFHLAKCTGHKVPEPKPFEEVREAVRQRFITEDQQTKSKALVERLRATATIEDREEEN